MAGGGENDEREREREREQRAERGWQGWPKS